MKSVLLVLVAFFVVASSAQWNFVDQSTASCFNVTFFGAQTGNFSAYNLLVETTSIQAVAVMTPPTNFSLNSGNYSNSFTVKTTNGTAAFQVSASEGTTYFTFTVTYPANFTATEFNWNQIEMVNANITNYDSYMSAARESSAVIASQPGSSELTFDSKQAFFEINKPSVSGSLAYALSNKTMGLDTNLGLNLITNQTWTLDFLTYPNLTSVNSVNVTGTYTLYAGIGTAPGGRLLLIILVSIGAAVLLAFIVLIVVVVVRRRSNGYERV